MSFFRQLGRGIGQATRFGRQIQQGANVFGRQLSNTAKQIGGGLEQAQRVVSKIEKPLGDVPILGGGLKVISEGLGVGKNLADIGQRGGGAIRALSQGNVQQAIKEGRAIGGELKDIGGQAQDILKRGGEVAGQVAMFV